MVWRKTSTPRTSAIISSVSRSRSGWTRATWSLETITLPSAERRSSIRCFAFYQIYALFSICGWNEMRGGNVPVFSHRLVNYSVDVAVLDLLCS